jgi:hypothetical protein
MSRNGGKPQQAGKQASEPVLPVLSMALCVALAHGNAASTYEIVKAQTAGANDRMPVGRFWYCQGAACAADVNSRQVQALADFVLAHPTAPPEALYRHFCGLRKVAPGGWLDQPMAERLAFATFSTTLTPLVAEARAEAAAQAAASAVATPEPDAGIFQRIGRRERAGDRIGGRLGDRQPAPVPASKTTAEAAE